MWLIAGLLAPFFWALTNLLDQIVIRKYYPNQSLLLMSINGLIQIIPFVIIAIYEPKIFSIDLKIILILITTALINILGFITYYKAIEKDEASNGVPILQLQPIIIFIGAYFLFGETVNLTQGIGAIIITGAAISLLIDFKNKSFNSLTLYLMGFCMLMLSLTTLVDRALLGSYDWPIVFAWKAIGYVIGSCIIFAVKPKIFQDVFSRLKNLKANGFHYIIVVEITATLATILFLISLAKAPAAGLAQTLTGFIPVFLLALSYLAFKLAPDFFNKPKQGFYLSWHLGCLAAMLLGLYLIY